MTGPDSDPAAVFSDLAGRIMLTHDRDLRHAKRLFTIYQAEAEEMIQPGKLSPPFDVVHH